MQLSYAMRKSVLVALGTSSLLLLSGLTGRAITIDRWLPNGGPSVSAKYNGPVATVPDNSSMLLLLGTTVLVLGLASRRFSIR
jgi:hypothetical protein